MPADHPSIARSYEGPSHGADKRNNHLARQFPDLYKKFLAAIRVPDLSINTERSYLGWINRFLLFHKNLTPSTGSEVEVASFLEYLALKRKVAAATQSQALNALVFFFTRVLERPLGDIGPYSRPKRPRRIPTVLSPEEVAHLLACTYGMTGLMAKLMYGSGMRLMGCVHYNDLHSCHSAWWEGFSQSIGCFEIVLYCCRDRSEEVVYTPPVGGSY